MNFQSMQRYEASKGGWGIEGQDTQCVWWPKEIQILPESPPRDYLSASQMDLIYNISPPNQTHPQPWNHECPTLGLQLKIQVEARISKVKGNEVWKPLGQTPACTKGAGTELTAAPSHQNWKQRVWAFGSAAHQDTREGWKLESWK